jgi:hypothetical protein
MKIKQACGWLVLVVLSALLVPLPASADGEPLEWVEVDKPGERGNIVARDSEVSEIAVGRSGNIYAVDSENSKVYQSLSDGATWEDITSRLTGAGAILPASKIAIAPDTSSTLAVVTDSGTEVYLTTDGGTTWTATNVPSLAGTTIQAIAISRQYAEGDESIREIAVGTADWGDNTTMGQVWVLRLGTFSSWQNQGLTGEVSALAFSPSYQRDNTIIAVASTGNDVADSYRNRTWLCIGQRDTATGDTAWDAFSDYPVEIANAGDDFGASVNASLALPSNYSGTSESSRQLFVSYNRNPDASDDVYRLDDTTLYRLNTDGGAAIDISSIAYTGTTTSGKLLAGEVMGSTTVQVQRTSNPFDSSPTWHSASGPPSGPGNAKVSWDSSGDIAYCGTSQSPGDELDESAFSMSSDDGDNWQQLSLMDAILTVSDIAPAPDSKTLFLTTYSDFGPEGIWRTASTQMGLGWYWSRQLTMETTSERIILRLSPGYASDYTIYASEVGGNQMAVSHNRGNSWKKRRTVGEVVDIVVEDENTVYAALRGGYVTESTNDARTWAKLVSTGLPEINMLAIAEKGMVLVGGQNGEVAYSTDGGASFTRIDDIGTGDVQVVADAKYQENGIIYAATDASDSGIWRWTIGLSTSWEQIDESITARSTGQQVSGLAMGSEGTLYALRLEPVGDNSGGMIRSLSPDAPENTEVEFDFTNYGLPVGTAFDPTAVFPNTLPYLKISGDSGQKDLWTIDTTNEIIYRFQDTLATQAPALVSPVENFQNRVNPVTGRSADIAFTWNNPSTQVTEYELGIYMDAACTNCLHLCPVPMSSISDTPVVVIGLHQSSATSQFFEFTTGTTYYWRVRSTEPLNSPWSMVHIFNVEPIAALVPALLSPVNGASNVSEMPSFSWEPISGATKYWFVLADNTDLGAPLVDTAVNTTGFAVAEELEYGRTYFWKVRALEPVEGAWSTLANFTVKENKKPIESQAPVVVTEVPPPIIQIPEQSPPPREIVIPPYPEQPENVDPAYIWAIIIIASILVITMIVLILRTRRPF